MADLKAKIPFGKKKPQDDEEFEDVEESDSSRNDDATEATDLSDLEAEDKSLVGKLKGMVASLKKGKKAEADEQDDVDGEVKKDKPKKKGLNPIQIVIVIGLIIFVFYDDIFGPAEEAAPEQAAASFKKPKREKKPKPAEGEAKPEEAAADKPEEKTAAGDIATSETPSDSPVQVTATDVPSGETPSADAPTVDVPKVDVPTVDVPSVEAPPPDTGAEDTHAANTPSQVSSDTETQTEPHPGPVSKDTIDDSVTANNDNLTDQILQDLEKQAKAAPPVKPSTEYVAPPDYEYTGRGLVYNCTGKHWACVDGPSYKVCEQNNSSTKYLKKKTECHPVNVYQSPAGCVSMQKRMVSSSAKTDFCSE